MYKHNLTLTLNTAYKAKGGTYALRIRAIVNRVVSYRATGIMLRKDQWDKERQRVVNHRSAGRYNALLEKQLTELEDLFAEAARMGEPLLKIPSERGPSDFIAWCEKRLRERPGAQGTQRKYAGFIDRLKELHESIPFRVLSDEWLRDLEARFRAQGNSPNTLCTKMKYYQREARAAAAAGLCDGTRLARYKAPAYSQTERTWLTKQEVDAIEQFRNTTRFERLRKVADWFLFSCYSGLRYSDIKPFDRSMIQGSELVLTMHKTGLPVRVPLHSRLLAVIERMEPGVWSNQQCNQILKLIAEAAGVEKQLSMHVGRHTFAVLLLDSGGTVDTLQELLGQKTAKAAKVYGRITEDRKARELRQVWGD